MTETSLLTFLEALRSAQLIEPGQWGQVERLAGESPSVAELARELVRLGWLTAYQANELNRGRGADLAVGPYTLLDRLGGGGMGEVYRARHRFIRTRFVALKVIRQDRLEDGRQAAQVVARFQREPEAMARLSHPNVAAVHDAGSDNGRLYLVMEYLEGTDLSRLVKEQGPLPAVVRRLTARRPEDRFQTPADAADALARYCGRSLPPPGPRGRPRVRTKRVLVIGAGLALFLLAGAWAARRVWPSRPPSSAEPPAEPARVAGPPRERPGAPAPADAPGAAEADAAEKGPVPISPVEPPQAGRKLIGHTQEVLSVAFVGKGDQALSCSHQEMIWWDLKAGSEIKRKGVLDRPIRFLEGPFIPYGVAGFPDGRRALIGGRRLLFWDLKKWEELHSYEVPHTGPVGCCVAVAANGKLALFANHSNVVRLFDAEGGKELAGRRLQGYIAGVSADGGRVLTGEYGQRADVKALVRLYDGRTGAVLARFGGSPMSISAVAISPDGTRGLSAGTQDRDFVLWDLSDPKQVKEARRFRGHRPAQRLFTRTVLALAFSPDGKRALSGGEDATVRLWDASTGNELGRFDQHDQAVTSVAFSPDGTHALSGSRDRGVGVWKLPR
jgi:hypothetical protein